MKKYKIYHQGNFIHCVEAESVSFEIDVTLFFVKDEKNKDVSPYIVVAVVPIEYLIIEVKANA